MTERAAHGAGPQPMEAELKGSGSPDASPYPAPWSLPGAVPLPAHTAGDPPQPAWPPYAPPYTPPYEGGSVGADGQRTTNRWAVVALVTGVLALVPVGLGAGITALVQIRRRGQGGTGLAVAGMLAAAGWGVVAVVLTVGFFVGGASSPVLGRVADAGPVAVGSCLLAPTGDGSVSTVVGCAGDHDAEVYLVAGLEGAAWPGYDSVDARADGVCQGAFEAYVGRSLDSSQYDYGFFDPDQGEWAAGEHHVVCVVMPWDQDTLRGTVRGSGR